MNQRDYDGTEKKEFLFLLINHTLNFSHDERIGISTQLKALDYCNFCLVTSPANKLDDFLCQFRHLINQNVFKITIEYFDRGFFESIDGYNKLLCSKEFYDRFTSYNFIIVSQPDVLLLDHSKLRDFSRLVGRYDYIGAPWFFNVYEIPSLSGLVNKSLYSRLSNKFFRGFSRLVAYMYSKRLVNNPYWLVWRCYYCGNGGFSIRKVETFGAILGSMSVQDYHQIETRMKQSDTRSENHISHEDIFWSILVKTIGKKIRIAPPSIAVKFAWESGDQTLLHHILKGEKPLAVHAWYKHSLKDYLLKSI